MPPRFKLPTAAVFKGTKKQLPGFISGTATGPLTEQDLEDLSSDITTTMAFHGADEASQIVPEGNLRERIRGIGGKPDAHQLRSGAIGATGGGLLGAGVGALSTGLSRGRRYAPRGLLAAIPGAAAGYAVGHGNASRKQVLEALTEELGPGAGVKRANVEPGFKEVLRHLNEYKTQGKLTMAEFSQAIRDLRVARGRDLSHPERLIVRKVILGRKDLPKAIMDILNAKPPKPPSSPRTPRGSSLPQPKSFSKGKAVGITAGATAALALLGLGVAHWTRRKDDSFKD